MEKKQEVTISLKWNELIYDIKNLGYIEGDLISNDAIHMKHLVQDIGEDGNVERVKRVLNLIYSECMEMLYPFTKESIPSDGCLLTDELKPVTTFRFILQVPNNMSITTFDLLKDYLHELFVCGVLADWFRITYPDKSIGWAKEYSIITGKVKSVIQNRIRPVRRKSHPF